MSNKIKLYIKLDSFNNKPIDTIIVPDGEKFKNIRNNLDQRLIELYMTFEKNGYSKKYITENITWQFRSSDNLLIYEGDFEIGQVHNGGTILVKVAFKKNITIEIIGPKDFEKLYFQTTIPNDDMTLGESNIYNDCIEYLKFHTNCRDAPSAHALYKITGDSKKYLLGSKYVLQSDEKYIWEWSLDIDNFTKNYKFSDKSKSESSSLEESSI
jgi:hypothetical protein